MTYIVALGVGMKCPLKIHLNTQCPPTPTSGVTQKTEVQIRLQNDIDTIVILKVETDAFIFYLTVCNRTAPDVYIVRDTVFANSFQKAGFLDTLD